MLFNLFYFFNEQPNWFHNPLMGDDSQFEKQLNNIFSLFQYSDSG